MSAIKEFFVRNHVVITLVSLIGGAHYMWYRLQFNDALRSPYEREHDPVIKVSQIQIIIP